MATVAYLGPAGTFSEAAVRRLGDVDALPARSIPEALDLVRDGMVDSALVPLENSLEGSVPVTLDNLLSGPPLRIVAEVVLPVSFALTARVPLDEVRTVASHPHALAQCRGFLRAKLPHAMTVEVLSTAAAARAVADGTVDAGICAPIAATTLGLPLAAEDIGDRPDTATRFVQVVTAAPVPASTAPGAVAEDHASAETPIGDATGRALTGHAQEATTTASGLGRTGQPGSASNLAGGPGSEQAGQPAAGSKAPGRPGFDANPTAPATSGRSVFAPARHLGPAPTGNDITSLAVYIAHDRVGALLSVLTELAARGVNLTRIESRPTGERLGRYVFLLDCAGHIAEPRMGEALLGLRRVCAEVRFLGSYPRDVDDAPVPAPAGMTDAALAASETWLADLRGMFQA